MLHEVASGTMETRHIVTPIRAFCKRAKFYAAKANLIDLGNRQVQLELPLSSTSVANINSGDVLNSSATTTTDLKREQESNNLLLSDVRMMQLDKLPYDYLVMALESETKFFGMADIEKYALSIKSWNDAIIIRNHVIHQLEQAELWDNNDDNISPTIKEILTQLQTVRLEKIY
jgi:NADH dehydrogenase